MKKLFYLIAACTFLSQSVIQAQVHETKLSMSLGVQNGFRITLNNADEKFIDKVWKNYVKDFGKLEKNKKAKEEYMRAATIKSINGSNPMDVYIITEDNEATVFFDLGNGFINSQDYSEAYKGAEEFVQE